MRAKSVFNLDHYLAECIAFDSLSLRNSLSFAVFLMLTYLSLSLFPALICSLTNTVSLFLFHRAHIYFLQPINANRERP